MTLRLRQLTDDEQVGVKEPPSAKSLLNWVPRGF